MIVFSHKVQSDPNSSKIEGNLKRDLPRYLLPNRRIPQKSTPSIPFVFFNNPISSTLLVESIKIESSVPRFPEGLFGSCRLSGLQTEYAVFSPEGWYHFEGK